MLARVRYLRSVIGHESDFAFQEFRNATRRLYGAVPTPLTPGLQLVSPSPSSISYAVDSNLFEAVINVYRKIAIRLVPLPRDTCRRLYHRTKCALIVASKWRWVLSEARPLVSPGRMCLQQWASLTYRGKYLIHQLHTELPDDE
jgi:hypothetical protein